MLKKITPANFQMLVLRESKPLHKAKKTPAHIADVSTLYFPCGEFFFKNKYGRIYRYRKILKRNAIIFYLKFILWCHVLFDYLCFKRNSFFESNTILNAGLKQICILIRLEVVLIRVHTY